MQQSVVHTGIHSRVSKVQQHFRPQHATVLLPWAQNRQLRQQSGALHCIPSDIPSLPHFSHTKNKNKKSPNETVIFFTTLRQFFEVCRHSFIHSSKVNSKASPQHFNQVDVWTLAETLLLLICNSAWDHCPFSLPSFGQALVLGQML